MPLNPNPPQVIVGEMKKSYAQTLITAYTKAAEKNLLSADTSHTASDSLIGGDPGVAALRPEPLSLAQQIDLECEGYAPSPPIVNKSYSVIQVLSCCFFGDP